MRKPARIQATRLFGMDDIIPSRHLVTIAAGPRGDLVVLSLDASPDYDRVSESGAVFFPKLHADTPNRYRVDHLLGGTWRSLTLPPTRENFHHIQPLGEEAWLLVRARATSQADRNACVYDKQGHRSATFHAGDGIEDVQTTEMGDIWVSYFDEGVFGDTNLGQAGLVCLDGSGRINFRFNDLAAAGSVPYIADCYALNVCSNHELWLCYYTDFPLVRLEDRAVSRIWSKPGVKGSHAFAVSGQHALFAGKYTKANRLFLALLDKMRVQERIPANDGGKTIRSFTAAGRGNRLYLRAGPEVFVIDLAVDVQ